MLHKLGYFIFLSVLVQDMGRGKEVWGKLVILSIYFKAESEEKIRIIKSVHVSLAMGKS